jgi:hypothetical protein
VEISTSKTTGSLVCRLTADLVLEQYANNRLIRPRTDYTGPPYPQTFLPLEAP